MPNCPPPPPGPIQLSTELQCEAIPLHLGLQRQLDWTASPKNQWMHSLSGRGNIPKLGKEFSGITCSLSSPQ